MSDYIPFDIQLQILKRLPVKSVLQFRSVSKQWKSFIDSSEFITGYSVCQTHLRHIRIWYNDIKKKYVSFVDEAITQQDLTPTFPVLSQIFYCLQMVGSSRGLLCMYGYYRGPGHSRYNFGTEMAVLWNLSIRKSIGIVVPCQHGWPFETILGFGVCPITSDPTIVKFTKVNKYWEMKSKFRLIRPVEVFTLSTGSWRIPSTNLPDESIGVTWSQVVIDRFIYMFGYDSMDCSDDNIIAAKPLIMSFDMTTHEFRVVYLPDCLQQVDGRSKYSIFKLWESLALLKSRLYEEHVWAVWMMECDLSNSFTKLFTINLPNGSITRVLGFAKSGEAIIETMEESQYCNEETAALVFYEPSSEDIHVTGIYGKYESFFVESYIETLLLLDHVDCSIYSVSRL